MALKRQRNLSALLILANLGIAAVCGAIMIYFNWNPGLTHLERTLWIALFTFSLVALLIASGFVEWLPGAAHSLFSDTEQDFGPNRIGSFIARWRMVFYYVGVWTNLIGFALVTETTGGLATSPFVAIFVAFVLTGQQLSRFRTQSGLLLISGLLIAGAMWACQSLVSKPATAPPDELPIAVVLLALALGGLLNYFERPHNYLLKKRVLPPSHARIYRDGQGIWRFAFYRNIHRQDPVLLGPSDSPLADGVFPHDLQSRFEKHAEEMGAYADWKNVSPEWPANCEQSFTVTLVPMQDDS